MTSAQIELSGPPLDTWANLSQGSIASVVSLLGIFIAFLLTRRHDRSLQKTEHDRNEKKQRIRESAEAVAQVVQATLPLRGTTRDVDIEEHCNDLSNEIVLMGIRLASYYPSILEWTDYKSSDLIKVRSEYSKSKPAGSLSDRLQKVLKEHPELQEACFEEPEKSSEILQPYVLPEENLRAIKAASWEAGAIASLLSRWAKQEFDVNFRWPVPSSEKSGK